MEKSLKELNCKLESLTVEYNNKCRELLAKQCDLDQVIRMIFEINSSLIKLNNQKASGIYQLNNLTREFKSQQKRVQRKKGKLVQNLLPLQSAFSLSCCKASKRKTSPFSDETPSR